MKHCWKSSIRNGIREHRWILGLSCIFLLLIVGIVSLFSGAATIAPNQVLDWIRLGEQSDSYTILQHIRLPRSLAALLCGISLAVSGLLLQSALNNPLASAGIIGVNSGAGLFVLLAGAFLPGAFFARTVFAFLGALLSAMLVFGVSSRFGGSKHMIIMTGIAISSLMSAGSDALVTLRPDSLMDKSAFFIGGFSHVSIKPIIYALPFVLLGTLGAMLLAPHLDVLMLGDETASSLGLPVNACRLIALVCAALLAASAVCIGGLLGFVGLMAPHAVRALVGSDHRLSIPLSACLGGILVTGCDILARLVFRPYEIPVGILLSLLGAPFFLFLIVTQKRGARR